MAKRSAEEYEAMAAEFEHGDYAVVGPIEAGPELTMGRPIGGARGGKSPVRTVRLPAELDARLAAYADQAETTPSDVLRRAVAEYLARHPLSA
ncbi:MULTISPECIES: CopG family ribbon-helix-helix protein [unclassified Nocardia]|uniref:CopG family ribbon-helix-helix protein n=1 Tax=unclassified Nocardia TaxID=2637762 RepID=UPI0033BE9107